MNEMLELEHQVTDHLREIVLVLKKQLTTQCELSKFTASQLNALIHLNKNENSTVTKLAQLEGISIQSMGVTVNTLKDLGLVSAITDSKDKRRVFLSLSAAGKDEIQQFRKVSDFWLAERIRTKLDPVEQKALLHGIELLKNIVVND